MSKSGKWVWLAGMCLTVGAGYYAWANRRLLLVGDITTGESAAYPELRSRVYYAETERVMNAAEHSLRRLPRWKIVLRDSENDAIDAEATAIGGLLTDDVTIYVISLGHGQIRVTIRARSRTGGCDWGRNAAHIRDLQQAMDDRLNVDAAFSA